MDILVYVPVDPPVVLTIEDYASVEPRDTFRVGANYPDFILQGVSVTTQIRNTIQSPTGMLIPSLCLILTRTH